jgi:hypothetical protein
VDDSGVRDDTAVVAAPRPDLGSHRVRIRVRHDARHRPGRPEASPCTGQLPGSEAGGSKRLRISCPALTVSADDLLEIIAADPMFRAGHLLGADNGS